MLAEHRLRSAAEHREELFYANVEVGNQHDRELATLISQGMNTLGGDYSRLDALAVSSGPGSFTGLRIGVSIAKGLAFGTDLKLLAVPTMDAIAYWWLQDFDSARQPDGASYLCPVIHSHKDFFYTQTFDRNFEEVEPLRLVSASELNLGAKDLLYVGPGLNATEHIDKETILSELNAKMISKLANKLYKEENFVAANDFIPYYAQEFEPKQMKEN